MASKDIYIIKNKGGLLRIKELLEEYAIYDNTDDSPYLMYGYKTLNDQCKQTYRVLYNLKKSLNQNPIKISLDYLSTVLSTSEDTQTLRLKELEKHELLKVIRKPYDLNSYEIYEPLPDYTFVKTIYELIKRKQLSIAINTYKSTSNLQEQLTQLNIIKVLANKGIKHYSLKDINQELLINNTV